MKAIEVKVPDIGDFKDVPVIEVFVKPGDTVKPEDPLVTLESDKATMDVPSPSGGVVQSLKVKVGDKVSEGSVVLTLEPADAEKGEGGRGKGSAASPAPSSGRQTEASSSPSGATNPSHVPPPPSESVPAPRGEKGRADQPGEGSNPTGEVMRTVEVKVPDIGDFKDVPVIEIFVKPGDVVKVEDPLVTLESDKATMDVPSPAAGVVEGVRVAIGDKVSEGSVLLTLSGGTAAHQAAGGAPPTARPQRDEETTRGPSAASGAAPSPQVAERAAPEAPAAPVDLAAFRAAHASPSVRRFARDLGVDLSKVKGSGPKNRILQEDVQAFVKQALAAPAPAATAAGGVTGGGELNLLPWPKVDFAKFGPVESKPLSRIKKISGANLARNWVMIPHVTQFDEADITELEALRVALNKEHEKAGVKVTMLAFMIKAAVAALRRFPDFNASIDGDSLVYKRYFHVGFAADTPNGLVVPVLKDADRKGVLEIAQEMADLSKKARDGKLGPAEMQGGCFTISSLGGIGGTAFTPIINAPEVAIMGVSRGAQKPVWDGKSFVPRLMLPLSLSYDHRVIDGASAARFTSYFAQILADFRRVVL